MDTEATDRAAWRLRVYPVAILVALSVAILFAALSFDRSDPESRLGGDYPAFYGAGAIAASGDWEELYSADRQQAEQEGLIDDEGSYLYFSYPPFVAGAYAPLAGLDYRWSFLVHTLLMAGALAGAVYLLWPWLAEHGWPFAALLVAALAFYPILRAVPGGQNTALSLLLLAAAARLDREDVPVAAGLVLSLLLYKPQFGIVIVPLLVVARRWRIVAGWAGGAVVLYAVSALPFGAGWIGDWWEQANSFRDLNLAVNGANFVSLPGFVENLTSATFVSLLGYATAAFFGLGVAVYWWRHPTTAALGRYSLAGAAVVLAAPQTLYYDAGLLALGMVVALRPDAERYGKLVAALIALSWLQVLSTGLGWSPLALMTWMGAGWLLWQLGRGSIGQPTPV